MGDELNEWGGGGCGEVQGNNDGGSGNVVAASVV